MSNAKRIAFIGLGVMGEPIFRNITRKSAAEAVDLDPMRIIRFVVP